MSVYNEKWLKYNGLSTTQLEREKSRILARIDKHKLTSEAKQTDLDAELRACKKVLEQHLVEAKERTTITFRCSKEEKLFIETLAGENNLTLSETIIELIHNKMEKFKKGKK